MTRQTISGRATLALISLFWLLSAHSAWALDYSVSSGAQADRLVLHFDAGKPAGRPVRVSATEVLLPFTKEFAAAQKIGGQNGGQTGGRGGLVQDVQVTPEGVRIRLKDSAFGFIAVPAGDKGLSLEFFADPIGAKWTPSDAPKATATPKPTPVPTPKATATPKATPTPKPTPAPKATPAPAPTPALKATPTPAPKVAPTPAPTPAPKTAPAPAAPVAAPAAPVQHVASTPAPTQAARPTPTQVPARPGHLTERTLSEEKPAPVVIDSKGPEVRAGVSNQKAAPGAPVSQATPPVSPAATPAATAPAAPIQTATPARPAPTAPAPARPRDEIRASIQKVGPAAAQVINPTGQPSPPLATSTPGPAATAVPAAPTAQAPVAHPAPGAAATPAKGAATPPAPGHAPEAATPAPQTPGAAPSATPPATPGPAQASASTNATAQVKPMNAMTEMRVPVRKVGPQDYEIGMAEPKAPAPQAATGNGTAAPAIKTQETPRAGTHTAATNATATTNATAAPTAHGPEAGGHGPSAEAPAAPGSEGEYPAAENATGVDYESMLLTAQAQYIAGDYDKAIKLIEAMKADPKLPVKIRKEAQFTLGDLYFNKYQDSLDKNFSTVISALREAVNLDPNSPRTPPALLQLGLVHLKSGNMPEAIAYFNLLKKRFPKDTNVPFIYLHLGDYYYDKGQYSRSYDQFHYIVENYPESKAVRDAALGEVRTLIKLGKFAQASQLIDYIEKRWPRYYVENPAFMRVKGDIFMQNKEYNKAKDSYWTYVNLLPKAPDADMVMAQIGDIYLLQGNKTAAREIYRKNAINNPDKLGGLISKMRLAEEGVYDSPTTEDMFSVFQRPQAQTPAEIYSQIVKEHPRSPLAPLAQLKLAMWYLFNKKYPEAIAAAQYFIDNYPSEQDLLKKAKDVGLEAFNRLAAADTAQNNYATVGAAWKANPFLHASEKSLKPETAIPLAYNFWKNNDSARALALAEPLVTPDKSGPLADLALDMALSIDLANKSWNKIVQLSDTIAKWTLSPERRREVDAALAIALENLGRTDKSVPLWNRIAQDTSYPEERRANANFFLSYNAMQRKDLVTAYNNAKTALDMYRKLGGPADKIKDCLGILLSANELSNRPREALRWAAEYAKMVPETSQDWPAVRYRLAGLYKSVGDTQSWKTLLDEIRKKSPTSMYGKLAASEMDSMAFESQIKKFAQ